MKCWAGWTQAEIKIVRTNINNLRYSDDTIPMAESEEELKSLLMKVKEESEKAVLKLNKAMVFPVVMYGCESWTVKKAESQRIDAFELWYWRRLLRVPWMQGDPTSPFWRRSALGFLGRNDAKAETLVLWLPHAKSGLIGKDLDAGRDWGQEEKGTPEDEMAGWHHWLDGHESEWTLGVGDGQGGLVCCDSWGRKELDMTEQLNWTENSTFKTWRSWHLFLPLHGK